MLRKDLKRATEKVLQALKETRAAHLFEILISRHDQEPDRSQCLPVFSGYVRFYQQFREAERRLISMLELDFLHDPGFWTTIMTAEDLRIPQVYQSLQSIRFAEGQLPKVLSLLARESDQTSEPGKKGEESKEDGLSQLSVTVIEERQQSSPERLVLALESIDGLYRACAKLMGESEGGLCVIACDSGSDKSFDFLGVAKIVDCVKEVILSFWDRVVYFREDKTERRLELVAKSLPILEQVDSMKKSGDLEPERAELIKRQVIDSVTKFADAGVTIPEIENFTIYNPRQLMKPQPKLLAGPKQAQADAGNGEEESEEKRTFEIDDPEFQAYMEKMAREFRGQKTGSTDASRPGQAEGLTNEPDEPVDGNKK